MSLAPASIRGACLKARLAVNGIQNAARSLGTLTAGLVSILSSMACLMNGADGARRASVAVHAISFVHLAKPMDARSRSAGYVGQPRHLLPAGPKSPPCRPACRLVPTSRMADKSKKPQKLKARLPRGLADRGPAEIGATRQMVEKIREVYERYGFEPVETPAMEYTDALGKFLPDQDRPNEGVFSFQDDDEQWISLRYDLTAPLARYVAENFDALPKPYRSYRNGYVYRNEKPGPGRFRQFMQFDADTVGSASPAADAEMCMMAADTMEALGIPRGSYVVKVNNRKVLDGVMESIGLGGDENAGKRLTVLRAIDKLDRLGEQGARELLGPSRKDENGDFTKGAGISASDTDTVFAFMHGGADGRDKSFFQRLENVFKEKSSTSGNVGLKELSEIFDITMASGYGDGRVLIDTSVVRGLEYYTGPV